MPHAPAPIPADLATRLGHSTGSRAALLGALALGAPTLVALAAPLIGLTGAPRVLTSAAFGVVVILGYQLWWMRILVAATSTIGRRIGGGVWHLLTRRSGQERPSVRPSAAELQALDAQSLVAAGAFRSVAHGVAVLAAVVLGLGGHWTAAVVVGLLLVAWGRALAGLGTAGRLPIPEGE